MNWLQKFSENELVHRFYEAQNQSRLINRDFPRQAPTYFESLVEDVQAKRAAAQPWKELLAWMQTLDPQSDPQFEQLLRQVEYNSRDVEDPNPAEYENWFDNEILEFYIDTGDHVRLKQVMDQHDIPYDTIDTPTGKKILTIEVGTNKNAWGKEVSELWVVEQNDDGSFTKWDSAEEWIEDASENPEEYYPEQNKSMEFWEGVGPGSVLYHSTVDENVEAIMQTGLEAREDTRGLSNRDMGAAVFTISPEYTDSPSDALQSYGDIIIQIDLAAMKADGYMPEISGETPVEEAETKNSLAHLIGYNHYEAEHEQDYMPDTIAVYGHIPPKYLSILHEAGSLQHTKTAQLSTDDIIDHLQKAIVNYIDGDWQVIRARRLMPSYRLQKYGVVEMMGRNVKLDGDVYYAKVFYEVRKRQGEIDYPPGYFADENPPGGKWIGPANSGERTDAETAWMHPYENADTYHPEIGHQLLSFRGFIEGWKGPNAVKHETEERLLPVPAGDPRSDMIRIGTFGSTVEERGMQESNPADTPFAVAQTIRDSIDRFWDIDSDEEEEIQPDPILPRESAPVGVPVLQAGKNWLRKISAGPYSSHAGGSLYHGTNKTFDSFDLSFAGARDWGDFGVGIYLSSRASLARTYAYEAVKKDGGEPVVCVVQANLSNVADFDELMEGIRSVGVLEEKDTSYREDENSMLQTRPKVDSQAITEFMTSRGFDAARVGEQVVVYDPSLLSITRVVPAEESLWLP